MLRAEGKESVVKRATVMGFRKRLKEYLTG